MKFHVSFVEVLVQSRDYSMYKDQFKGRLCLLRALDRYNYFSLLQMRSDIVCLNDIVKESPHAPVDEYLV
jgi:hypothetical protein